MGLSYVEAADSPTGVAMYRIVGLASIENAASTVFAGDGGSAGRIGRPIDYQGYYEHYVQSPPDQYTRDAPYRHQGGANYVFCDGHSKWYIAEVIYPHPTPPSTAYSTAAPQADCAYAKYFAVKANERAYWAAQAVALGNTTCSP